MRNFPYITLGKILHDLETEGLKISRFTFLRLEARLKFPIAKRTNGKIKWRVYSRQEAEHVKTLIKEEYNFSPE